MSGKKHRAVSIRGRVSSTEQGEAVGYGKPPRAHQFKPGQSGNPKGRTKGTKNEDTILRDLLNRKIEVRDGGRVRKMIVMEAILLRFVEDALKGNTKSAAFLFNRYAGVATSESESSDISAADQEILNDFLRRFIPKQGEYHEGPKSSRG
jgi:uncharacterized protein DUF5681